VDGVAAREFAHELHGDITRLPGPGHLAYVEDPGTIAEVMNRFHTRIENTASERDTSNGRQA